MWRNRVEALKLIAFSLAVVGFYAWYSNTIPQIESHPPKKISLDGGMNAEEMIEAGERVYNSKGTCNICHAIGRPGNRGPDLADISNRAAQRKPGLSAREYLLESLIAPPAYLVKGYGPLMPPMAAILSPGEIMVTVAYLQSLGGEVDITPGQVRSALAGLNTGGTSSATSSPALTPPPSVTSAKGNPEEGERVYRESCMPCHGPDPALDGPIGPRIKGATPGLIEARVMRATYPPGFRPQRPTRLMPAMPQLQGALPHLAAFLAEKE